MKDKKTRKAKAQEPPKLRILLLFLMIWVFVQTPILFGIPIWASIPLGVFCADLFYFLLVVLGVHRNVKSILSPVSQEERNAHKEAAETAREVAQGGIVLLQNTDDLLPLPRNSKLNLIGLRCAQLNYNGGGSAASDESKCTTLEQALRETGFQLNQDLLNLSYNYLKNQKISIASPGKHHKVKSGNSQKGGAEFVPKPGCPVKAELPVAALTTHQLYADGRSPMEHAREYSDLAMIVMARGGGEGYDLDPDDLRLIESEKLLLEETARHFDKIILVLNTANTVEMSWLKNYPQIRAVLWIGFPGTSGTLALGDILNGSVNPSGRLPDTWAADNLSCPAAHNFCELTQNGTWNKESFHYRNAPEKVGYFVHYREGIYVGYRYFETRAALDPDFEYEKEVVWPFGFGLSYTIFEQAIVRLEEGDTAFCLNVSVQNRGSVAGRETVQCYVTPPYTGHLEKSVVKLVAFGKTGMLAPGETETVVLNIPKRELASFDAERGMWVLEAGDYKLSLRSDSHTELKSVLWELDEECVLIQEKSTSLFKDATTEHLSRDEIVNHKHPAYTGPGEADYIANDTVLQALYFSVPTDKDLGMTNRPRSGQPAGLKLSDVKELPKEDEKWETFVQQLTVGELCNLCGNGAWQTVALERFGVPRTLAPDGPTSMAATVFSALVMGTCKKGITWPCPGVLAANFDPHMAWKMGDKVGAEGAAMGYRGWYAPAMNLHRTAFNSRNFEYYSEDPLLSGKNAAQVVNAVQKHKVICYVKHFALNERETNARRQLFTWCDEQTMRELYFHPFELAVREGKAWGVMSCFNYIGHIWAGGSKALLTDLLRKEWGFEGIVVTDACLYPHMDVTQMVYAGGDLSLDSLGGFTGGNKKRRSLLAAVQDPARKNSMLIWLQRAAKDILYTVGKTIE